MRKSSFTTWLAQLLGGLTLIGGGLQTAWIFWADQPTLAFGALAVAGLGFVLVALAEARERPKRVMRKARQSLGLPSQWAVEFDRTLPEGGEAPVVVTRGDSARFVIDVISHKEVSSRKSINGKYENSLLGPNGKTLRPDPLPKLKRAARELGATPVLWLPEASTSRNIRLPSSNLIVVMGAARHLKHALLGAEPFAQASGSSDFG